jgi:hypothetical protein
MEHMSEAARQRRPIPNEEFHRRFTSPEDRKDRWLSPWEGDFRWFESANVVALELYRSQDDWDQIRRRFWPKRLLAALGAIKDLTICQAFRRTQWI